MSEKKQTEVWNSLEVTKLLMSLITPVLVVGFGLWVNTKLEELKTETEQWKAVVAQRVEYWKEMALPLNDIYVYIQYVGNWQEITPQEILSHKRKLDRIVYSNRPFFSEGFFSAYRAYIEAAFRENRGWKEPAGIKSTKQHRDKTHPGHDTLLEDCDNRLAVHASYFALLDIVADDLALEIEPLGRPPNTPGLVLSPVPPCKP